MAKPAVDIVKGVYCITGAINEKFDFEELKNSGQLPIRINLEGAVSISSIGIRNLKLFIESLPDLAIELYDCPRWIVDILNVIPGILSTKNHRVRVVSAYTPYHCKTCNTSDERLVRVEAIRLEGTQLMLPVGQFCKQCNEPVKPSVDTYDYFLFCIR